MRGEGLERRCKSEPRADEWGTGRGCGILWADSQWHHCRDGKSRRIPTEPGLFPLAHARDQKGYRVAALRGAGNAINIGVAAVFVRAAMEAME